ncbi:MAG TPA: HEAT repeat domain-containing protein, partial [Longimicrobium sp.]|nr:HEAT repeat domain-containing protein [Longimicrobium sp.]
MTAVPFLSLLSGADPVAALVIKATLILGAAALGSIWLRNASASARHFLWTVAIAGVLALPVASRILPYRLAILPAFRAPATAASVGGETAPLAPLATELAPLPGEPAPLSTELAPLPAELAPLPADPSIPGETPLPAGTPAPASAAPPAGDDARGVVTLAVELPAILGFLWAAGAALLLARLLAGFGTVWYLSRRGERVDDPEWTSLIARLERRFNVRTGIRLVRTDWTEMPMTFGIVRPVVLLPMDADEWPAERREVVLTHELAHIARADVLVHALGQIVCALYWFNPLAWIAMKNLRAEAERCCDDWVLRAGTRASTYAEHLLSMVRTVGRARVPAALALPMAQRSTFEGRLLAILEPGIDRGGVGRARQALTGIGVAALVIFLAAVEPAGAAASTSSVLVPASAYAEDKDRHRDDEKAKEDARKKSEQDAVRAAADVLASSEAPPAALAELRAELKKAGASDEARARTVDALRGALGDATADVRISAVRALGSLQDPRSVAALSNALRTDRDPRVREAAAWALGQIEDAAAVPALSEALTGDREAGVRRTAAWALGQIEDGRAVDGLVRALRDSDAEVRATAVWALGQIEDPRALPALTTALREGDVTTRRHAVWALGQIESVESVPAVTAALRDADAEVRMSAVWALGQIESPQGVAPLLPLLRDGS